MSTINASVFRNTRFEIRSIHQGPNSFALVCSPRNVAPNVVMVDGKEALRAIRIPELEVHENAFTDAEMLQVHAVFAMLENKFAAVYDGWSNAPERSIELITEAVQAKKDAEAAQRLAQAATLEKQRLDLEAIALRAEVAELEERKVAAATPLEMSADTQSTEK